MRGWMFGGVGLVRARTSQVMYFWITFMGSCEPYLKRRGRVRSHNATRPRRVQHVSQILQPMAVTERPLQLSCRGCARQHPRTRGDGWMGGAGVTRAPATPNPKAWPVMGGDGRCPSVLLGQRESGGRPPHRGGRGNAPSSPKTARWHITQAAQRAKLNGECPTQR